MTALAARLARHGLNLIGATSPAAYDARVPAPRRLAVLAPTAKGVIVVGNGGSAFWWAYRAFCASRPGHDRDPDPLDRFTREVVTAAVGEAARCVFPFDHPAVSIDFQTLAETAGLGRRSLLGVLVHPEYGPWMALRAAVLVAHPVRAPRPADGFDPCPPCVERPCMAACPVGAVTAAGWDVAACAGHRLAAPDHCAPACAARAACVYGRAHRPPDEALAFHQAAARAEMARYASARNSD